MIRCITPGCEGTLHRTGCEFPTTTPIAILHCATCRKLHCDKGDGRVDDGATMSFTAWTTDEARRYCVTCKAAS